MNSRNQVINVPSRLFYAWARNTPFVRSLSERLYFVPNVILCLSFFFPF